MHNIIPLTRLQKEIMQEFYSIVPTNVIFSKSQRNAFWKKAKSRESFSDFDIIKGKCPALAHQIQKSYDSGNNIQSAVFSECVFAQTFANMLNLDVFINCLEQEYYISTQISNLLHSYHLFARYVYTNSDNSRMLIQAGGCNGIDSALISVADLDIYTIEFKEAGAKSSEPDLPKYDENGKLKITDDFLNKYPQFEEMLKEQRELNFFEVMVIM